MRYLVWICIMFTAVLGTACGAPTPATNASPAASGASTATESAQAEASAAAESTAGTAASAAAGGLEGATWQWVSLVDPAQTITIESPENYTLTFGADNTVAIKADCNQASGTYEASSDGALRITVGPSTLAACPEGSRGQELLEQLGFVTRYFIQGEQLNLEMMADGGTLTFDPQ